MNTTEITIKRNFVYNPLDMEHLHISVTKTVVEGENTQEVLKAALKEIDDFYADVCKNNEPQYKNVSKHQGDKSIYEMAVDKHLKSLMEELQECDNLEILKSYRFTHKTEQEQKYYEEKLEKLTKK